MNLSEDSFFINKKGTPDYRAPFTDTAEKIVKNYLTSIILFETTFSPEVKRETNIPDDTGVPFSSRPSQTTE